MRRFLQFFLFLLLVCGSARAQSVAPIQGLGQIQFFSNTGAPLTNGVLYVYQAGTTTQQATFTDSTGLVMNPNPITFSVGARASVWLTVGAFYKFVLCAQNDGSSCAPGDTIYSVDNVPGGATGTGSSGSPFTGIFISQTASPATSGILRLASGDSICWRNQAGTTNLCWSKTSNDLLSWSGGSLIFPEITAPTGCSVANFECIWADNVAHRWLMTNGVGSTVNVVGSGVDINTSDQVTQLHFGATAVPLCSTPPTTGQALEWNGTQGCWATVGGQNTTVYNTTQSLSGAGLGNTTMTTAPGGADQNYLFTVYVSQTALSSGCSASPTVTPKLIYEDAATTNVLTIFMPQIFAPGSFGVLGLGGVTLGQVQMSWAFRAKAGTNVFYSVTYTTGTGCSSQGSYFVAPNLVQQ